MAIDKKFKQEVHDLLDSYLTKITSDNPYGLRHMQASSGDGAKFFFYSESNSSDCVESKNTFDNLTAAEIEIEVKEDELIEEAPKFKIKFEQPNLLENLQKALNDIGGPVKESGRNL